MRTGVNHVTVSTLAERAVGAESGLFREAAAVFLGGAIVVVCLGNIFGDAAAVTVALLAYGVGSAAAGYGLSRIYPYHRFGPGNAITLVRLALASALVAPLAATGTPAPGLVWLAFAVALLALSLDAADGWAARRTGLASPFGARFDMEVDSVLALVLALLAYDLGHAGIWVLALGLPRYLFLVAGWVWPWLRADVPERFSRKAVCVLQIGVLVLLLIPVIPGVVGKGLALVAVAAVGWSFAKDITDLRSRRP